MVLEYYNNNPKILFYSLPANKSDPVTLPTIDPKEPGAYEMIRQKNIAEREKLFRDLKISQMKTGISHTSK